jgi:hypothetical protein
MTAYLSSKMIRGREAKPEYYIADIISISMRPKDRKGCGRYGHGINQESSFPREAGQIDRLLPIIHIGGAHVIGN